MLLEKRSEGHGIFCDFYLFLDFSLATVATLNIWSFNESVAIIITFSFSSKQVQLSVVCFYVV